MDNFSQIQRMGIQDYITNLVVFKDLDNVCLDVTTIIADQVGLPVGTFKYYLTPVHSKNNFSKMLGNFNLNSIKESVAKKSVANLMYDEILHYRADKFVFNYFNISVFDVAHNITQIYSNTDNVTTETINFIVSNGLLNISQYTQFMQPKIFYRLNRESQVMQYKGYNYKEIKEWIKNATEIIFDPYQSSRAMSFLCNIGSKKTPVYLVLESYIVKLSNTKFVILPSNVFEALYDDAEPDTDTVGNYFYGADVSYENNITAEDILALEHRSEGLAENGTRFEIESSIDDTRIVIAYPASLRDIHSIIRADYYDGDVKSVFTKSIVRVELVPGGDLIDYKVYTYIPGQPFVSNMRFIVTI